MALKEAICEFAETALHDKRFQPLLFLIAAYFIYRFGKSVGETIYYLTH